jgi:hypothetical protein
VPYSFQIGFRLFLIGLFLGCSQTKRFQDVEVRGRLIHFLTSQPLAGLSVELRADDVHSSSSFAWAGVPLDEALTDINGDFVLKSKATKGDNYYLEYESPQFYPKGVNGTDYAFRNTGQEIIELGVISGGEHTFKYRIRLKPVSTDCLWFQDLNGARVKVMAGTDTMLFFQGTHNKYTLERANGALVHTFSVGPCSTQPPAAITATFPGLPGDTLDFEFQY